MIRKSNFRKTQATARVRSSNSFGSERDRYKSNLEELKEKYKQEHGNQDIGELM